MRRLTALAALTAFLAVVGLAFIALTDGGQRAGGSITTTGSATSTRTQTRGTTSTATTKPKHHPAPRPTAVQAGTYAVGQTSVTFDEPATAGATPTGNNSAGQPVRALPTVIRYPVVKSTGSGQVVPDYTDGPFPLVVFSQGFLLTVSAYNRLLNAWASAGYVVAAPTYPWTNPLSPTGGGVKPNENDLVNHPADLRYVISTLQSEAHQQGNLLHGLLNPASVGIIGHSDGGEVSLAVAANSAYQDSAVRAAAILSGAEWDGFAGTYYSQGSPPLLVVQGDHDIVNAPGCSVQLYDQAPQPKYFLDVPGAGHEEPYVNSDKWRRGVIDTVVAFFNSYLKKKPAGLESLSASGAGLTGGETITSAQTLTNEVPPVCSSMP